MIVTVYLWILFSPFFGLLRSNSEFSIETIPNNEISITVNDHYSFFLLEMNLSKKSKSISKGSKWKCTPKDIKLPALKISWTFLNILRDEKHVQSRLQSPYARLSDIRCLPQ